MIKKSKFKPIITRVKLNPEQALLNCPCYTTHYQAGHNVSFGEAGGNICSGKSVITAATGNNDATTS